MFRRELLGIIRPGPGGEGLIPLDAVEEDGVIRTGRVRSPGTGEIYRIENGYLDLLGRSIGADNVANLTNFLPGAGRLYEPLWRVRSLTLLTGFSFSNERELGIVSRLARPERGLYLDLGCSAGLYTRAMARALAGRGGVIGIDISPSMLKEAARRVREPGSSPSFVRADWQRLPFADAAFSGAVCGGTLNEVGDPARALRETGRVIEPGGHLAVMGILKARSTGGRRLQGLLSTGGVKFFHPDELRSMLNHAGFDPDQLETHGPVFFAGATRRG
jgi:SAM-dependent methyltransferase